MDGNVASMSLQERGAYITLLCICWQEMSLPSDVGRLANIVGLPARAFSKIWPHLSGCFVTHGDRLFHPRLEKERQKQSHFSQRQSEKGLASAAARASRKPTNGQPEGNHGSTNLPPIWQPEGNSPGFRSPDLRSPIPDPKERVHTPSALAGTLPRDHLRHSWCSSRGKCVPDFLHAEFAAAVGGDGADQRLRAFYDAVERGWPEGPIGDDPVKLWRKEFAAKFPSVAPHKTAETVSLARLTPFEMARRAGLK